jgi:SAM-dependent methyltransferase
MVNPSVPVSATKSRHPFFSSRYVQAAVKALLLLRSGKGGLLLSIPLYRFWWRLRGLDFGIVSVHELKLDPNRANYHKDGGGPLLRDVLDQLGITANDVVLDLGSGKGGAMATLARYPFKFVDGVEIAPELAAAARKNFDKLNLPQCRVFIADAAEYADLDPYTYIFMFNPFPEVVLEHVLKNLEHSLRRTPRRVRLLYSNPLHETMVLASGTFKKTFVYQPYPGYMISVYENAHAQK